MTLYLSYTVTTRMTLYLKLLCHHHADSFIKTGSDESRFNISFIVRGKVNKTVSTVHNL